MKQYDVKSRLKECKLKATPQRLSVHEAMQTFGQASADMIYGYIRNNGDPHVTVASVYNILNQFADIGLLLRRPALNGKIYFDIRTGNRATLYDTKNHEFHEIKDEEIVKAVEASLKGRRFRGYKLDRVDIQLICHSTRKTIINK